MAEAAVSRLPRRREQHAARMRRHRQRQVAGRLVVPLEFTPEETDRLCRLRYLGEAEVENRDAIAAAVHCLLANIIVDP